MNIIFAPPSGNGRFAPVEELRAASRTPKRATVVKEGSRETGLRDEIEHLARGHDGLGLRNALLREPIDLPGERLDLSNAGRWAG